jgi:hypothetical protein
MQVLSARFVGSQVPMTLAPLDEPPDDEPLDDEPLDDAVPLDEPLDEPLDDDPPLLDAVPLDEPDDVPPALELEFDPPLLPLDVLPPLEAPLLPLDVLPPLEAPLLDEPPPGVPDEDSPHAPSRPTATPAHPKSPNKRSLFTMNLLETRPPRRTRCRGSAARPRFAPIYMFAEGRLNYLFRVSFPILICNCVIDGKISTESGSVRNPIRHRWAGWRRPCRSPAASTTRLASPSVDWIALVQLVRGSVQKSIMERLSASPPRTPVNHLYRVSMRRDGTVSPPADI